jgi:hypothetical protein
LTVAITENGLVRVLAWTAAGFAIGHFITAGLSWAVGAEHLHRLRLLFLFRQFNLDEENNLPTFFSCALLAIAAGLLFLIARRAREDGDRMTNYWRAFGVLFAFMSFDEFCGFHERFGVFLVASFHAPQSGATRFPWVVAGLPFVAAVGAVSAPFLRALPRRTRNAMLVAGLVYVGGALGMELADGWYFDHYGEDTTYALLVGVEETLEMTGVILFIRCLLGRLADRAGELRLVLREAAPRETASQTERPAGEWLHPRAWMR